MANVDLTVAAVFKKFRATQGVSQEELAFKAKIHRTYVSQLERGLKSVTLKTLLEITNALGIELMQFMQAVDDEMKKA